MHLCLLPVGGIVVLFCLAQIAVGTDQFPDPLLDLIPPQKQFCIGLRDSASADFDSFSVVAFIEISAGNCRIRAADAIFVFQKGDIVLGRILFEKLLIDAEFALMDAAAPCQNGVDILLRNSKSGGLFFLRFCDDFLLLFNCGERYA